MSAERRLLLVSDRPTVTGGLRQALEHEGYLVLAARDTQAGLEQLRQHLPDLAIVDAATPAVDGPAVVRALRDLSLLPILELLPRPDSAAIVRALDAGADDCAAADLPASEVLARVRALLRRAEMPPLLPRTTLIIDDQLTLDFSRALVLAGGQPVALRPTEYRLLYHLASQPGRVLPYESLLARVWGPEYHQETHYVQLYVAYLRQKIEPDPAQPRYILTERGLGYRFVDYRPVAGRSGSGRADEVT
ncbi:MAG: response regulator transcription factor [Chloroflexi bacterium]|nr:response regulator transcription factor [Chloroflexota bacterium]